MWRCFLSICTLLMLTRRFLGCRKVHSIAAPLLEIFAMKECNFSNAQFPLLRIGLPSTLRLAVRRKHDTVGCTTFDLVSVRI